MSINRRGLLGAFAAFWAVLFTPKVTPKTIEDDFAKLMEGESFSGRYNPRTIKASETDPKIWIVSYGGHTMTIEAVKWTQWREYPRNTAYAFMLHGTIKEFE